jgi:hypothetical protein
MGCGADEDRKAQRCVERGGSEGCAGCGAPIEFTSASGECEPFDVVKHLTTDRLKEKLRV